MKSVFGVSFTLVGLLLATSISRSAGGPTIQTKQGTIEGRQLSFLEHPFNEFLGIPFAKPPTGENRLKPPVYPADSWGEKVYNATFKRASCVQKMSSQDIPGAMSEDCLYLNVYQPTGGERSNLSVMVWIYGGSFVAGSATLYDGRAIATMGDVIVVTLNYRLGALGFLSTGDDILPGNYGLWDQAAAMQWVQDNIGAFGGNPEKVTIIGESAGSCSVNFQLLSPHSRNLFVRAISESGSATGNAFQVAEEARESSETIGKLLGCSVNSSQEIAQCLSSKDASEILTAQDKIYSPYNSRMLNLAFRPVIDGSFLPRHPVDLLRVGEFKKCEYLTGTNADEYSLFLLGEDFEHISLYGINETYFEDALENKCKKSLIDGQGPPNDAMKNALRYAYTNWANRQSDIERRQEFIKLWSDCTFVCPMILQAPYFSNQTNTAQGSKLYMYEFTHLDGRYAKWMGVPHAAELDYVFGVPFFYLDNNWAGQKVHALEAYDWTAEDRQVSSNMIKLWTNFAKTGNPLQTWPAYNATSQSYLNINTTLNVQQGLHANRCAAWIELLPQLERECSK